MLYFRYDVYGAAPDPARGVPRVSAGYSVGTATGQVLASAERSEIQPTTQAKLSRLVGTQLPRDTSGSCELLISLRDEVSGRVLELREPFTVAP